MVFCNNKRINYEKTEQQKVTILILVDGFLQFYSDGNTYEITPVTILILVDGFLQSGYEPQKEYIILSQSLF